jgi:actin cytoskeleton-regulatory complex protein PAN1
MRENKCWNHSDVWFDTLDSKTMPSVIANDNREESTSTEDLTSSVEPADTRPLESASEDDSDSEYQSFSESEDDVSGTPEEQRKRERETREVERQRVLEAAGLIVKKDEHMSPPQIPHLKNRRPPPAVPDRLSIVADSPANKDSPVMSIDIDADESDTTRLDDAYERYEAFKLTQSTGGTRLSVMSVDPSSPLQTSSTSSLASYARAPNEIADNRTSYSNFLSFLGRARTPVNDGDKKPTYTISGPIITRESSPVVSEDSPQFGKVCNLSPAII